MSRATVDLQSVRFFLGYGLVFIIQSALTILLAAVAMFALQPGAGRAVARSRCRSWSLVAARYGRRSRPALQEVQQRIAELTADVEENVSGVRVVKAFARRAAPARALPRQRRRACSTSRCIATRLRAFYNPFIGFLPNLGLAVILLVGGRQVIDGTLTLGDFTAFYAYLLMLIGADAARSASRSAWPSARPPRARGCSRSSTASRALVAPAGRAAAAAGPRARRAARRHVRLRRRAAPALRDVDLDVDGRHDRRAGRRHRLGQDDARRSCSPRLYDVTRGRGADRRRRRARRRPRRRCGARSRVVDRRPVPVLAPRVHENIAYGAAGRDARGGRARPPSARRRPASSPSCPTATTRGSASAG